MRFRNYCIVVMGDTKDVILEISKVAESKPNYLDATGILISTFSSAAEPNELTDYFKLNNRSFLLFDLNIENSGFHITKKNIHEGLFGFLELINDVELKKKTEEFMNEVSFSSDTTTTPSGYKKTRSEFDRINTRTNKSKKITEADVDKMTKKEKEEMLNILIDKGVENLTEHDKKIVQKLAI